MWRRTLFQAVLVLLCTLFHAGCSTPRVVREGRYYQLRGERAELRDSTQHTYFLEVLRLYDPTTGALAREELAQRGTLEQVVVQVRDTVYLTQVDTVQVLVGQSAPLGEGVLEVERTRTSRWWVIALVVALVAVVIVVVRYVRK